MSTVDDKDTATFTDSQREELRSQIIKACKPVSHYWPMKTFIHHNPLHGLEDLHFEKAIEEAERIFGGHGYLPNRIYRDYYKQGRITEEGLNEALKEISNGGTVTIGDRNFTHQEILRTLFLHGSGKVSKDAVSAILQSSHDPKEVKELVEKLKELTKNKEQTVSLKDYANKDQEDLAIQNLIGKWCDKSLDTNVQFQVKNEVIKWVSGFLDEGHAHWDMPLRETSFYTSWKELASEDGTGSILGIPDWESKIQNLPESPEDVIMESMSILGIPKDLWSNYFTLHLAKLEGWTGFLKWRSEQIDYVWQTAYPTSLVEYMAIRLVYERELVDVACRNKLGISGNYTAIKDYLNNNAIGHGLLKDYQTVGLPDEIAESLDASMFIEEPLRIADLNGCDSGVVSNWEQIRQKQEVEVQALMLLHLAKSLEVSVSDVMKNPDTLESLVKWIEDIPDHDHGPVWLKALESSFIKDFVKKFSSNIEEMKKIDSGEEKAVKTRPSFQGIFCIDVRSESFRRRFEEVGANQTFGYAGFFGVPLFYQGYTFEQRTDQCPVLLKPQHIIKEIPRSNEEKAADEFLEGKRIGYNLHALLHDLKENVIAPYIMVEAIGWFFGLRLFGQTLRPKWFKSFVSWIKECLKIPLEPTIKVSTLIVEKIDQVEGKGKDEINTTLHPHVGFTLEEQTKYVSTALGILGFKTFSRLILLCAHGSTSDNNPFESALDCGACGGNHGHANARALTFMANNPKVRARLAKQGIEVPDDTHFLAGQHDTTTDEVDLFDLEDVPDTHQDDLVKLKRNLHEAGERNSRERLGRLPDEHDPEGKFSALERTKIRSIDWSQVRPEWGLSKHTAFIAGRRLLTQGINLEGRTFLHSYDSSNDPEGNYLEIIMTAPMIVGQWINMEHYFSTVDQEVYGAGSKAYHNVVGRIGVMFGTQSDLCVGLPYQTVFDYEKPFHEPMRLFVVIESPRKMIETIISKHALLQQLTGNQWLHIVALEPDSMEFFLYQSPNNWDQINNTI